MQTVTGSSAATRKRNAAAKYKDAIAMLVHEHQEVKKAFKHYEDLGDGAYVSKKKLAEEICLALTKHTTIEEEIFYPAARKALGKAGFDLLDEAEVEHASAKELIAQIQSMSPQESLFDAKVKVLSEQIEHHVGEEEGDMFPKLRKTDLDLVDLGKQMAERKEELDAYL